MCIVLLPFVCVVAGVEGHGILCRCTELGFQMVCGIDRVVDAGVVDDGVRKIDIGRIDGRDADTCRPW